METVVTLHSSRDSTQIWHTEKELIQTHPYLTWHCWNGYLRHKLIKVMTTSKPHICGTLRFVGDLEWNSSAETVFIHSVEFSPHKSMLTPKSNKINKNKRCYLEL